MNSRRRVPALTLLALAAAGFTSGVLAQTTSPKLILQGTNGVEIPLDANSTVSINAAGNLTAQCRNGICPATGSGGSSGNSPPSAVTLTGPTAVATANTNFLLNWSSVGADVCYGSAPASVTNWTGRAFASAGSQALNLPAAASAYPFQLRCYSSGGSLLSSIASVTVETGVVPPPPPPAGNFCDETYPTKPTDVRFTAHGYTQAPVAFNTVWVNGLTDSTEGRATPHGFMSDTRSKYLAIPFSYSAAGNTTLTWIESLATVGPTGGVTVTISPCPGDFRKRATTIEEINADPYLSGNCRANVGINGIIRITSIAGNAGCMAPVNKTLYLNIASYDMYQATPSFTCTNAATSCGVLMRAN